MEREQLPINLATLEDGSPIVGLGAIPEPACNCLP